MHEEFTVETTDRVSVQDITQTVSDAIPTDVGRGLCTVYVPHTTAGVTVNEAEERLLTDLEVALAAIVDNGVDYRHDEIDDNAAAHLKSMLLGPSISIPVTAGGLDLGTWQSILFFDGDGPRTRRVEVTVIAQ